jgi:hypothetical protein
VAGLFRLALALALSLALAACYETDHEVFGPKDAAIVPGLAGHYVGDNEEYIVAPIRHTPDYSFRDPRYPDEGFLRFRAIALGGGLYLMQLQQNPNKPNVYWHIIFRVDRAGNGRITQIVQLEPKADAVAALARQFALTLERPPGRSPDDPQVIAGNNESMAAFIRGLKGVPVEKETVLRRTD